MIALPLMLIGLATTPAKADIDQNDRAENMSTPAAHRPDLREHEPGLLHDRLEVADGLDPIQLPRRAAHQDRRARGGVAGGGHTDLPLRRGKPGLGHDPLV